MTTKPRPPADLAARGRKFWRDVLGKYDLNIDETQLLTEICRSLDECESLRAIVVGDGETVTGSKGQVRTHPALSELRQARALLGRLLAQLGLPTPDGDQLPSARTVRAQKAAGSRWARHNEIKARREGRDRGTAS